MVNSPEDFERRIAELRAAVRRSLLSGDRGRAETLRTEMRAAERGWDDRAQRQAGAGQARDRLDDAGQLFSGRRPDRAGPSAGRASADALQATR